MMAFYRHTELKQCCANQKAAPASGNIEQKFEIASLQRGIANDCNEIANLQRCSQALAGQLTPEERKLTRVKVRQALAELK